MNPADMIRVPTATRDRLTAALYTGPQHQVPVTGDQFPGGVYWMGHFVIADDTTDEILAGSAVPAWHVERLRTFLTQAVK